jgi:hypothetical protein
LYVKLVRLTLGTALLAFGCTGNISGPGGSSGGVASPGGPGVVGPGGSSPGNQPGGAAPGTLLGPSLRLLTNSQYRATLRTLFSFADELSYDLEDDVALNGLRAIGSSNVAVSLKATEAYQSVAQQAAQRAFADAQAGSTFAGCNVDDATCASGFIADFGRRAYRRALAPAEQSKLVGLYQSGVQKLGGGAAGLQHVVQAILGSPHFLYRAELGEPSQAGPTARRLSDVELASKLAYFLSDAPPDAELLQLAESGGLSAAGALAAQTTRLLGGASAAAGMESLFDDYLSLNDLATVEKLPSQFPTFTPSLLTAMRRETLLDLSRAATAGGDFRNVFNSSKTFVNRELAELYGVSGVTGDELVEVTLPADSGRRGLLGQASVLSLYAHASVSSPTLRGKFVRQVLLCQAIPAPPPDVDTTLPDTSEAATARERFTIHRTNPNCAACHQLMDPIGLGLENFDAIGRFRTQENGQAIDASGDLDGQAFSGPAQLSDALASHPGLASCLSRTVFRYAWGRLENQADEPAITELATAFSGAGHALPALLRGAVSSSGFVNVGALD